MNKIYRPEYSITAETDRIYLYNSNTQELIKTINMSDDELPSFILKKCGGLETKVKAVDSLYVKFIDSIIGELTGNFSPNGVTKSNLFDFVSYHYKDKIIKAICKLKDEDNLAADSSKTHDKNSNKQPFILSEALDLIGEISELNDDDYEYYHQNIVSNSKTLNKDYFD